MKQAINLKRPARPKELKQVRNSEIKIKKPELKGE